VAKNTNWRMDSLTNGVGRTYMKTDDYFSWHTKQSTQEGLAQTV
jgi:hypothetical protein